MPVPLYPFVPQNDDGLPNLTRAAADANVIAILQQSVALGTNTPLLTNMLNGSVPSMLNGLGDLPAGDLLGALDPQSVSIDSISQQGQAQPKWGLFDDGGAQVVKPSSIVSVEFSGDFRVISYPIEKGNFESYNKVREPFEIVIKMRQAGSISDRQDFITILETIRASLDLYTVATPEKSYANVNIVHVDYPRREAMPAVIDATIRLQEINVTASSSFSDTQQPEANDPTNGGTVEAQTPDEQQSNAASGGAF